MCYSTVSPALSNGFAGYSTHLADDVDSAGTSAHKVCRLAVCVFEGREEVVPSCCLRLQCVLGVDVGERGLGGDVHVVVVGVAA